MGDSPPARFVSIYPGGGDISGVSSAAMAAAEQYAPNSSLQDLHAFVLEQQPSFDSLFLWGNEDSLFNSLLWYIITALLPFLVGKMRRHYLIV